MSVNETHNIELSCWVDSANQPECDFPIQNLPFCIFKRQGQEEGYRGGVAIGDQIIDLLAVKQLGVFSGEMGEYVWAASQSSLNEFMALGKTAWSEFRLQLSRALRTGAKEESQLRDCLVPQASVEYSLPCQIGDYTDFYSSVYHASAVGALFRPDNPLLPNYKWVPIAYHGRASSIDVSGQMIRRPQGQIKSPDSAEPVFGACKRLDYEVELGIFVGSNNQLGQPVTIEQAEDHVFGICLFNDWSARDLQAWEYQPLGPFLAKNFASTISPWIVTLEALAPFREAFMRDEADPQPLSYLSSKENSDRGAFDIQLSCLLQTELGRQKQAEPVQLSQSNFKYSYWTVAQMVTHHTVNGCNLQAGDLLGTGTQSGPAAEEAGSILELTKGGKEPLQIRSNESRTFLEDGDEVIMRGWCERSGARRIGFGEVVGTILPVAESTE